MISYCGLNCEECEAFIATKTCDNQLKAKVAQRWAALYSMDISPEDVHCGGCKSVGTQGIYCQTMCRIKPCCREKGLDSCAPCPEFPCREVDKIFTFCPEARKRLMNDGQ